MTAQILRDAAGYVRGGWVQGELYTRDILSGEPSRVCANGALISAIVGHRLTNFDDIDLICGSPRLRAQFECAEWALKHVINQPDIPQWNNARDQTAENVAVAMELAAVFVEENEKLHGVVSKETEEAPVA